MPKGKVKWFNNAKGYGFILADEANEDLFAHYSSIQMEGYKTLKAGQTVYFDTVPSGKGTHAINITPEDEVAMDPAYDEDQGADVDQFENQHETMEV